MASYIELTVDRVDEISRRFDLDLTAITPLDGGTANSSYLAFDRTDRSLVVVTLLDNHDMRSARWVAGVLTHLAAHSIQVQRVRRSPAGTVVAEIDGTPVIVKEFVRGIHKYRPSPARLSEIGAYLARVHGVLAPQFLCRQRRQLPPGWLAELTGKVPRRLTRLLEVTAGHQPSLHGLPSGLIHGDLFADNLLFTEDRGLVGLDWETAAYEPFVLDLGIAAVAHCRTGNRIDLDRLSALIVGYETVRRLTWEERATIPTAVLCATGILAFGRYVRHNVTHPDPVHADAYIEMVDFGSTIDRGARRPTGPDRPPTFTV